jgi:DNA-binding LacI/PurR family transcriptional regulator
VRQDKSGLGRAAASALLRAVERAGEHPPAGDEAGEDGAAPEAVTLPVELVVRDSTAPPPS